MQGYVFDIKRFAIHDGPGIRTTVFLQGCPLDCPWCHNPESREIAGCSNNEAVHVRTMSVPDVLNIVERDRLYYDESGGGVTFSGGEPLVQSGFLREMLQSCRDRDLHTAVDTSGYAPWSDLASILPFTDLFLYDLKLMNDAQHLAWTGVSNSLILSNLRRLDGAGARVWVRIPAIADVTDQPDNLEQLVSFCRTLDTVQQIHVLPFHPGGSDKRNRYGLKKPEKTVTGMSPDRLEHTISRLRHAGKPVHTGG